MMVRSWSDLDLDALCARAKVFGFDLDNTLASSKQPMKPAMIERFGALTACATVALISGGSMAVVTSQVLDVLGEGADRSNLHVMPTAGSRYYRWDKGQWTLVYAHDLGETASQAIESSLERHAKALGLWEERVWGPRIENRGSQITFSALGQYAPVEAKQAWDPDNTKKRELARAVQSDFPELKVRPGGYSSVDVSEHGLDKGHAVRTLAGILGIQVGDIVFVGDRMTPEGNDYPAVEAGAVGVAVRDPEDALGLMDALLARIVRKPGGVMKCSTECSAQCAGRGAESAMERSGECTAQCNGECTAQCNGECTAQCNAECAGCGAECTAQCNGGCTAECLPGRSSGQLAGRMSGPM
jgi:HAD superfamily hydrolase (TIGR01484 family)